MYSCMMVMHTSMHDGNACMYGGDGDGDAYMHTYTHVSTRYLFDCSICAFLRSLLTNKEEKISSEIVGEENSTEVFYEALYWGR